MQKTFAIPTITCKHCLMSIKRELKFVDGVEYVDGNVSDKTVLVTYSNEAALDQARSLLGEAGYAPSN